MYTEEEQHLISIATSVAQTVAENRAMFILHSLITLECFGLFIDLY